MILISACLAGVACRYNGGSFTFPELVRLIEAGQARLVCPEVAGGLPTPRNPIELDSSGFARDRDGQDYTGAVLKGINLVFEELGSSEITAAVLKDRSPSCGYPLIYDGSFSGTTISGKGLFAGKLLEAGIPLYNEFTFHQLLETLGS